MRTDRKGTAAVEFALVAPLLCIMILGMLEMGRALQVQQALTNAVREGCRAYCDNPTTVRWNGTTYNTSNSQDAIAYARDVVRYCLENANVGITSNNIGNVTITPSTSTPVKYGNTTVTPATVTATLPYSLVAFSPPFIMGSQNLTASITMNQPPP